MNYNYILYTGQDTISGSSIYTTKKNEIANFSEEGFSYNFDLITGANTSLLSFNSQTLPEGEPVIVKGANQEYRFISGDFSGQYFTFSTGYFDPNVFTPDYSYIHQFRLNNIAVDGDSVVLYDQRTGSKFIFEPLDDETDSFEDKLPDLRNRVHAEYNNASTIDELFENNNIFFNGQKIKKGDYPAVGATGCFSSVLKNKNVTETFSGDPDVYGTGFVKGQVNYYINGMESPSSDYLELYTGMTGIVTGVTSRIVLSNATLYNYNL